MPIATDMLTSVYSGDLVGRFRSELNGTPWQNPDALVAQSPAYYAKNFKTPMLIIHGANDYRVDLSNGLAMFQLLQAMNVPSKLIIFTQENHFTTNPADSIFWYHSVLDWLDLWSKPDSTTYQQMLNGPIKAGQ
jgi:dipeptidyl aminopeptidase/acylaminoacyl peptidase